MVSIFYTVLCRRYAYGQHQFYTFAEYPTLGKRPRLLLSAHFLTSSTQNTVLVMHMSENKSHRVSASVWKDAL